MPDKNTLDTMIESGAFAINLGGHKVSPFGAGSPMADDLDEIMSALRRAAYLDGVLIGLCVAGKFSTVVESTLRCLECGDKLHFELSEKTLSAARCSYPEGVPLPFQTTLEIPSGRLAFSDWFTFMEEPMVSSGRDTSMLANLRQFKAWAAIGFPKAECGNSCPGVYRMGNTLLIGAFRENGTDEEGTRIPDGYMRVGSVTTDFRSWHCGDLQLLSDVAASADVTLQPRLVVDMPAGAYKVSVHSIHSDHKGRHFATIEPVA